MSAFADALCAERSLVVSDPTVGVGLLAAGINAVTNADLRAASDPATLALVGNGPAVLVLDPTERGIREADIVRARLSRLTIPHRVVRERMDPERLP
jgi:hypothetical protein